MRNGTAVGESYDYAKAAISLEHSNSFPWPARVSGEEEREMASSSPRKRSVPVEFEDFSGIKEPTSPAVVHGIVTSFSPMKKDSKKRCFDGYMSDGKKKMRFVGFRHDQQDKITDLSKGGKPLVLSNCAVKMSRSGDSLEVIVNDSTRVNQSDKKYEIECMGGMESTDVTKEITLNKLKDEVQYQSVSVKVKVVEVREVHKLDDGRQVQNVVVADHSGTTELALWQDFVGQMVLNKSYEVKNVKVKSFRETYSLFTPKENVEILEIEDLKEVVNFATPNKPTRMIANAKVIAVSDFASDLICISCNKGSITPIEESRAYGRCSQCPTTLLLESCKLQVSALLTIISNGFKIKLSAVDDKLAAIAGVPLNDINDMALLTAPVFTAVYNNSMVIIEVSR